MATNNIPIADMKGCDVLTCQLCLHVLETPHTFQQCLHSYCKLCIEDLPVIVQEDKEGWSCPLCKQFTAKEEVKHNEFLEKLIILLESDDQAELKAKCNICLGVHKVKWKCEDCRVELCENCQSIHQRFPANSHHKTTSFEPQTGVKSIDELLLCDQHSGRFLEFSCKTCNIAICALCKVLDHDVHPSETISHALEGLMPEMNEQHVFISEKMEHYENQIHSIKRKIEQIKSSFAKCRKQLDAEYQQLLCELEVVLEEQKQTLAATEAEALQKLEEVKLDVEAKVEECKQLINMFSVTVQYCNRGSLLTELQEGLIEKMKLSSEEKSQTVTVDIPEPYYISATDETGLRKEQRKLLQKLEVNPLKVNISSEGTLLKDHYICGDARRYFQHVFHMKKSIDLTGYCNRVICINDQMWVPSEFGIKVYSLSGDLVKTWQLPFVPWVVRKVDVCNKLFVGGDSGLYVLNEENPAESEKLADGHFTDLDVYGFYVYAIEYTSGSVLLFTIKNNVCRSKQVDIADRFEGRSIIKIDFVSEAHTGNRVLRTEKGVLFSSLEDKCIFMFDTKGVQTNKVSFTSQLFLCGLDGTGKVIAANFTKNKICSFDETMNEIWLQEFILKVYQPWDLVIDSQQNLWVIQGNNDMFRLVQFIPRKICLK